MIRPEWEFAPLASALLLLALVGGLAWRAVRRDRREYPRFKRLRSTAKRQRTYRKWLVNSFLVFGGASVVLLALVWPDVALLRREVESFGWVVSLRSAFAASGALGVGILIAVVSVLAVGSVAVLFAARSPEIAKGSDVPALGDIQALLPRNRAELRYGALLSVNAGVVEELLFRLAVPALLFGATGSAAASIVLALVLFGALHVYQGVAGVIGATVIGGLLMVVYLGSGSILSAIALHAFIDLRSLVLIPVIVLGVHRRPARRSGADAAARLDRGASSARTADPLPPL